MSEDMMPGEIHRSLARIEKRLESGDAKFDSLSLDVARYLVMLDRVDDRIVKLEEWQTWMLRIVVAAVLTALIALVITVGPTERLATAAGWLSGNILDAERLLTR